MAISPAKPLPVAHSLAQQPVEQVCPCSVRQLSKPARLCLCCKSSSLRHQGVLGRTDGGCMRQLVLGLQPLQPRGDLNLRLR